MGDVPLLLRTFPENAAYGQPNPVAEIV